VGRTGETLAQAHQTRERARCRSTVEEPHSPAPPLKRFAALAFARDEVIDLDSDDIDLDDKVCRVSSCPRKSLAPSRHGNVDPQLTGPTTSSSKGFVGEALVTRGRLRAVQIQAILALCLWPLRMRRLSLHRPLKLRPTWLRQPKRRRLELQCRVPPQG
jgi:hypothetical protein